MYERFTPTIVIRKSAEQIYQWFCYLSPNKNRPTCISPIKFDQAFKARESALEFAKKLKGPLKIKDRCEKTDELLTDGELIILDETKVKSANKFINTDIH